MSGIKRIDIILIFIMHFFVYILSVVLFFNSLKSFEAIAVLYYLFSIIIFISIIVRGMEKHPGKKCWKILLFFDFVLFFIILPILPLFALSGLAWR